ncbi:hypothetical protein LguiB_034779 [Lonicera macranthoides]
MASGTCSLCSLQVQKGKTQFPSFLTYPVWYKRNVDVDFDELQNVQSSTFTFITNLYCILRYIWEFLIFTI